MGRRNWTAGDSVNMSIGQGEVLVTPLQLANAYATIANGGTHYKPLLVQKVVKPTDADKAPTDPDNPPEEIEVFNPVVEDQLEFGTAQDGRSHLQVLQAGFEGVINNGRGTANDMWADYGGLPGRWAAKTGTAEARHAVRPQGGRVGLCAVRPGRCAVRPQLLDLGDHPRVGLRRRCRRPHCGAHPPPDGRGQPARGAEGRRGPRAARRSAAGRQAMTVARPTGWRR
ncbi:MAG: penicillin-binding transpeptidase domain-containing protein [Microthrixaceae bacterium]